MKKLLVHIIAAMAGLWIASSLVPEVILTVLPDSNFFGIPLTETWQCILILGIMLGLLNFFVKPVLEILTLPLRILTLGLFNFVINAGLIFALDMIFVELSVPFMYPLLYTTLIMWGLTVILSLIILKKD